MLSQIAITLAFYVRWVISKSYAGRAQRCEVTSRNFVINTVKFEWVLICDLKIGGQNIVVLLDDTQ